MAYITSGGSLDFLKEYPIAKVFSKPIPMHVPMNYAMSYFITWPGNFILEVFLFGLMKTYGAMGAVLIQTVSSCLIHIGKPVAKSQHQFWPVYYLEPSHCVPAPSGIAGLFMLYWGECRSIYHFKTYRMAIVLITRANGFIGSHLVQKFLREGHQVKAFVRKSSDVSF